MRAHLLPFPALFQSSIPNRAILPKAEANGNEFRWRATSATREKGETGEAI
jgi:hypothetical protein